MSSRLWLAQMVRRHQTLLCESCHKEMCILLNDAWELLSDPEKRKDYDAQIEPPCKHAFPAPRGCRSQRPWFQNPCPQIFRPPGREPGRPCALVTSPSLTVWRKHHTDYTGRLALGSELSSVSGSHYRGAAGAMCLPKSGVSDMRPSSLFTCAQRFSFASGCSMWTNGPAFAAETEACRGLRLCGRFRLRRGPADVLHPERQRACQRLHSMGELRGSQTKMIYQDTYIM